MGCELKLVAKTAGDAAGKAALNAFAFRPLMPHLLCKDLMIFHDLFIGTSTMFDMLKWLKPICLFILFRRYFMAGWSMFEP